MEWQCKVCKSLSATKGKLLKHYRLQHATFGGGHSQPCLYSNCPCTFKTQSALRTHLSRYHATKESLEPNTINTFKCLVCDASCCSERDFFLHIRHHLKSHETVVCVFEDCNFRTNIYNTFLKHKSRTHQLQSLSDFKQAVYQRHYNQTVNPCDLPEASADEGPSSDCGPESSSVVLKRIGLLLLKLESIYNVSVRCIDSLVEDLHFISSSASVDIVRNTLDSTLRLNQCKVDQVIITDLAEQLCNFHPISTALGGGGPLSLAFKRRRYFKKNFHCVNPVEYILDFEKNKTFQYVSILKTLQELFKKQRCCRKGPIPGSKQH